MPANLETQQWPQDWKRSVFIPIPKTDNAKECSNYHTIALISHASKVMLKIIQVRLQQYMNCELPGVQTGFRKGKGTRMWSTGEGNGKPLQYSCLDYPMNSVKRQNDRIPKEELPRSVGAQYATGDQWRNNSRKNEGMEPKQKQYPVVDVAGDRSKV